MNRWTLSILTGALALPVGLTASGATHNQSLEDSAWGASPRTKSAPKAKKHPAGHVSVKELQPTVAMKSNASNTARIQPAKHVAKPAPTHEKPPAVADTQVPGAPVDFGTDSEGKAYQKDADDAQAQIAVALARAYGGKKPSKPAAGLSSMIQLQPKIEQALTDENLSSGDRDSLHSLVQQRDTALYMLSASLVAQKKEFAASAYLKFLAKSAGSGTPMRDAAAQQLAQLGIR